MAPGCTVKFARRRNNGGPLIGAAGKDEPRPPDARAEKGEFNITLQRDFDTGGRGWVPPGL
jgi:hypothetical protein